MSSHRRDHLVRAPLAALGDRVDAHSSSYASAMASARETIANQTSASGIPPARRIAALSALVANQIAAGEVVERPASVVKELVENALDAGSTRLQVEIEAGGIELVRVTDDGAGIVPEDLPLAVAPHATSKISSATDLDHIATLGFRGEALASIASVSRLSIRSRTREAQGATQLDVEGAQVSPPRPAAGPVGTCVTVRNLFFNTPARRKFLKTAQTEKERCVDVLTHLALAHPAVAFAWSVDGRTSVDLPAGQTPKARALDVMGRELEGQLIQVSADRFDDARGMSLWGLAGLPSLARGSIKGQHIFVNGRSVRDRTVQHAISEAYRGLIEPGRHPTVLLMLELSPEGVDVNVHPQKAEVRFRDASMVHSTVLRALRDALQRADLTPLASSLRPQWGGGGVQPGVQQQPTLAWSPGGGDLTRADVHRAARGDLLGAAAPGHEGLPPSDARAGLSEVKFADFFSRFRPGVTPMPANLAAGEATTGQDVGQVAGQPSDAPSPAPSLAGLPVAPAVRVTSDAGPILQVHNSYVITQDAQGVVIIDQHALHERVMFEYLVQRVAAGVLESQRMLMPVPVQATRGQLETLTEASALFARIGLEITPAGAAGVLVHAFPSFLFERGVDVVDFLEQLLRKAEAGELESTSAASLEHALRDVLDMMACKAAIKAGDRLSDLELAELIQLREDVERSSNCPHGRPTSIRLSLRELERLFGRA
jgi:DNA mismatch repair protein MutL